MRSDSKIGYVYAFNIYQGKCDDAPANSTLGERVVNKLLTSVKCPTTDVTIAKDIFFNLRPID